MNIVVLTTQTTHHTYYVGAIAEHYPIKGVLIERFSAAPQFSAAHAFETRREDFERSVLLKGLPEHIDSIAPVFACDTLSEDGAYRNLKALRPDVILVFGTGRVPRALTGLAEAACLNLHGGDPEHYRGLDSHLWAIYHEEFHRLVTTLHMVAKDFDTGDIVSQTQLRLHREHRLEHLRAVNTRACVELTLQALDDIANGTLQRRAQTQRGRYYSFMPSVLKELCLQKFERYRLTLEASDEKIL